MRNGLHLALAVMLTGTPLPMPGNGFWTCTPQLQSAPSSCCGSECRCGREATCVCRAPQQPASPSAPGPAFPVAGSVRMVAVDLGSHPAAWATPHAAPVPVSPDPAECRLSMSRLERFCTLLV